MFTMSGDGDVSLPKTLPKVLLPRARLDLSDSSLQFLALSESEKEFYQQLLDDSLLEKQLHAFYENKKLNVELISATRIYASDEAKNLYETFKNHQINHELNKTYDMIVFVSKHAGLLAKLIFPESLFLQAQLFAVGKSCATFFTEQGFSIQTAGEESAQGLLSLPEFSNIKDKRILICKGAKGLTDLQEACVLRGAEVKVVDLYQREAFKKIKLPEQDIVEIYGVSVFALKHLLEALSLAETNRLLEIPLAAMSERIARTASSLGFANVRVLRL